MAEDRAGGGADVKRRLRRLFHLRDWGPRVDEGVAWELEHHLAERVDELVASGYTPDAARQEALRTFGDVERVRRELVQLDERVARRRFMGRLLDDLIQDIRYGLRSVRLRPGLAAGIVVTLALGIGANSALFSVADALLLRPLPYTAPHELADVWTSTPQHEYAQPYVAPAIAREWQASYDGAAVLHARRTARYTGGTEALTLAVQAVTPEFHEVFGIPPLLGRGLLPEDALPGAPDVALIDHGFWQAKLGGDAAVLGSTIMLNGIAHTVIGVMPPRFRYPTYSTTEAWVALRTDDTALGSATRGYLEIVARVPSGRLDAANAQAAALGGSLFQATNPASETSLRLRSLDERRTANADLNRALLLLAGAVVLILVVAGVNMINLLLARGASRSEEIAVRLAVGAARGRIVRQIGTEAMLLALLGGLAAVFVAVVVVRSLHGIMPGSITFWAPYDIAVEQRTLLFTFMVATVSGLLFGLLPAFAASSWVNPGRGGRLARHGGQTPDRRRLRRGLVVAEVAFSVTLVITAALLINSFTRLMRVDPGIRLDDLVVLTFDVSTSAYPDAAERGAYLRLLEERVAALPGVEAATIASGLPPRGGQIYFGVVFEPEDAPPVPASEGTVVPAADIAPNYFDVTGAKLLEGRTFTRTDDAESGHVIIDADLAGRLWPGRSAVGRRFRLRADADWLTVIGVSADLRLTGPDERRGEFAILRPFGNYDGAAGQLVMAVRTRGNPNAALAPIRAAVRAVDPDQPILDLQPARSYYAQAVDMPRFLALLTGILAGLAMVLAAVGIHGVLAFGVAQRRHELGVRMVLGARAGSLGRLVVGEGMALALIGTALGIGGALLATRIVQGVLYGVEPADMPTFAFAVVAVLLVAALATLRPALRVTKLDPVESLRSW